MKLFCDHEELIEQLKGERDSLRLQVSARDIENAELREALRKAELAVVQRPIMQPQQITREAIAKRMGIPESVVDQIDLERLGVQFPEGMVRR